MAGSGKTLTNSETKRVCTTLNYIEHLLILAATVTGRVSTSTFVSLVGIAIGIMSSAVGLKICSIISGTKTYNSIIKKKNKKHDKRIGINSKN